MAPRDLTRSRRSRLALFGGTTAAGVVLAATPWATSAASATNEFPPNPSVTAQIHCFTSGAKLQIVYRNEGGAGPATFETTIDGVPQADVFLPVDDLYNFVVDAEENATPDISVTADEGFTYDVELGPIDCAEYAGTVVLECRDDGPVLVGDVERLHGPGVWMVTFETSGTDYGATTSSTNHWEVPVDEDAAYHGTLSTFEQTLAHLEGVADCEQPPPPSIPTTTTVPPTTSTSTSTTSTTVPEPEPTTTTIPDAEVLSSGVAQAPVPVAAPRPVLARTGVTTAPLALGGTSLVAAGAALVRSAARRRSLAERR